MSQDLCHGTSNSVWPAPIGCHQAGNHRQGGGMVSLANSIPVRGPWRDHSARRWLLLLADGTENTFSSALFHWINVGVEKCLWMNCIKLMCMKYYSLHQAQGSTPFRTPQEQVEKNAEWRNKWHALNEPYPPTPTHPCFLTEQLTQKFRSTVWPGKFHIKNNIKQTKRTYPCTSQGY